MYAGNKTDLGAQRKVSTEDGKKLAGSYGRWNLTHEGNGGTLNAYDGREAEHGILRDLC